MSEINPQDAFRASAASNIGTFGRNEFEVMHHGITPAGDINGLGLKNGPAGLAKGVKVRFEGLGVDEKGRQYASVTHLSTEAFANHYYGEIGGDDAKTYKQRLGLEPKSEEFKGDVIQELRVYSNSETVSVFENAQVGDELFFDYMTEPSLFGPIAVTEARILSERDKEWILQVAKEDAAREAAAYEPEKLVVNGG